MALSLAATASSVSGTFAQAPATAVAAENTITRIEMSDRIEKCDFVTSSAQNDAFSTADSRNTAIS
jgi:hypothetical protein